MQLFSFSPKPMFAALIALCTTAVTAQKNAYSVELPWQAKPVIHTYNSEAIKQADAVYLNDTRIIEYKFVDKDVFEFQRYYKLIKVVNDKGIEMFNKIYVPVYKNTVLENVKARTILPNGKVQDLPADKIKEVEEEGTRYKLFALEGVEKGAEVEYTYTVKKSPNFFGTEIFQSASVPCEKANFLLAYPSTVIFDAKGFNGFTVTKDTLIDKTRYITGTSSLIKEISDTKYANPRPYMQRVDYKLSYNSNAGKDVEINTWKEFAKRTFNNFTTLDDKENKALDKFIGTLNLSAYNTDEAKIMYVENFIKQAFNIDDELARGNSMDIKTIIESHNASDDGITRFMTNLFQKIGIKFQIVFPSVRNELPLDEELANWNRVEKTLLYFPQTGKYLSPASKIFRYPFVPPFEAATRGLFLKEITIGNLKTAVGTFGDIEMEPFDKHAVNMEEEVAFNASLDTLFIKNKQVLLGYGAYGYRPVYNFLPKDKQDEVNKEIIKNAGKSTDIKNIKVENSDFASFNTNKPLTIYGDITTTDLLENAGNKVLLKVGEMLGNQVQMYQEKPRVIPVDLEFPHVLDRTIKITIPAGYSVKNLNDLNMDISFKKDGVVTMGFVSKYTLNGNVLDVIINETYHEVNYPLEQFEDFKKVINAAADFNKVVLVLEKK